MKRIAAGLALFIATTPAWSLELLKDMYISVAAGRSILMHSPMQGDLNQRIMATQPNANSVSLNSTQVPDSKYGAKLQLGYHFSPYFAVEGGYVDLGNLTYNATHTLRTTTTTPQFPWWPKGPQVTTTKSVSGNSTRETKVNGWNIAALGIYPLGDRLALFAKAGGIRAQLKTSDTGNGFGNGSTSSADWRANLGVGAIYALSSGIGLRAEIERFNKLGDKDSTGTLDVNLLSIGLTGQF
jgi:OOP family OmpA-OmpF porin